MWLGLRTLNLELLVEGYSNCMIGSKTMSLTTFFVHEQLGIIGESAVEDLWLLALVTSGRWHVTCDNWHVTCDMWFVREKSQKVQKKSTNRWLKMQKSAKKNVKKAGKEQDATQIALVQQKILHHPRQFYTGMPLGQISDWAQLSSISLSVPRLIPFVSNSWWTPMQQRWCSLVHNFLLTVILVVNSWSPLSSYYSLFFILHYSFH